MGLKGEISYVDICDACGRMPNVDDVPDHVWLCAGCASAICDLCAGRFTPRAGDPGRCPECGAATDDREAFAATALITVLALALIVFTVAAVLWAKIF